jgi:hypothetical protein
MAAMPTGPLRPAHYRLGWFDVDGPRSAVRWTDHYVTIR